MRMPPQARAIQARIETFFNTTQTVEGRMVGDRYPGSRFAQGAEGTLVGGVDYAAWAKNDIATVLGFIRQSLNMVNIQGKFLHQHRKIVYNQICYVLRI